MSGLPRILEPEVMDTPEEARDYDAMDHSEVNRLFVEHFRAGWSGESPVLDVGTGTAQIPIELCRADPSAHVIAVDAADSMLDLAHQNIALADLGARIELRLVDAKGLPFAEASFPSVMSNSIVHHIPEPRNVLAEMLRVLAPNGWLFVRDLMRPRDGDHLAGLVEMYAGDAGPHAREMFRASLHAALTLDEVRALVVSLGQDGAEVEQTSDRHWTWTCRKQ